MTDIFLGIDVAQESFHATLLIGKEANRKFRNNPDGFAELSCWVKEHGAERVWACMEFTNKFWVKLAEFLIDGGHKVSMISPAVAHSYSSGQRRAKNDRQDSRLNATYCRDWRPKLWEPPTLSEKKLKEISRTREFLKKQHRALENHLDTAEFEESRVALQAELDSLSLKISTLDAAQMRILEESVDMLDECARWDAVKGIGMETAIAVMAEFGSLKKFERYITLRRLAGLDSVRDQSGTCLQGKERSSKKGNKRIRAVLYMAAMSAMQSNPRFKRFAERLKARGKLGKVIVGAVANKLLLTMWALSRHGTDFASDHTPDWLMQPSPQ